MSKNNKNTMILNLYFLSDLKQLLPTINAIINIKTFIDSVKKRGVFIVDETRALTENCNENSRVKVK